MIHAGHYLRNFRLNPNCAASLTVSLRPRKFDLNYQIPYIDRHQKAGLTFNLDYGEPKNLAYFTENHKLLYFPFDSIKVSYRQTLKQTYGMSVTYNYRKSFYETHSISIGYRSSTISDTIVALNPNYYKNRAKSQRYAGISYSFNSDHRDVILYPLKGYQFGGYISYLGLGSTTVNLLEINIIHSRHWDLKKRFYLSNFTSGYLSTPSSQPYSLYNALGYRKQLVRGYEIYVIEGPKFALNNDHSSRRVEEA